MVLAVVQLTDPITHIGGSFDASGDDFLPNFVTQYLLTQIRHDRSIENRPITEDRAISARSRSVAEQGWPVAGSARATVQRQGDPFRLRSHSGDLD